MLAANLMPQRHANDPRWMVAVHVTKVIYCCYSLQIHEFIFSVILVTGISCHDSLHKFDFLDPSQLRFRTHRGHTSESWTAWAFQSRHIRRTRWDLDQIHKAGSVYRAFQRAVCGTVWRFRIVIACSTLKISICLGPEWPQFCLDKNIPLRSEKMPAIPLQTNGISSQLPSAAFMKTGVK